MKEITKVLEELKSVTGKTDAQSEARKKNSRNGLQTTRKDTKKRLTHSWRLGLLTWKRKMKK